VTLQKTVRDNHEFKVHLQYTNVKKPPFLVGEYISGGEGGIRTPGRSFGPYNGLANRRIQPLCHLSGVCFGELTIQNGFA
jgi:hypothetical protein